MRQKSIDHLLVAGPRVRNHPVGPNLILRVGMSGAGSYVFRKYWAGKIRAIGLGPCRRVTYEQALAMAAENETRVYYGLQPAGITVRRQLGLPPGKRLPQDINLPDHPAPMKLHLPPAPSGAKIFADFAPIEIDRKIATATKKGIKPATANRIIRSIKKHAPRVWTSRLCDITKEMMIAELERPGLLENSYQTAGSVLRRVSDILDIAVVRNEIASNPINVKQIRRAVFPASAPDTTHRVPLPLDRVQEGMILLRDYSEDEDLAVSRSARILRLLALTGVRKETIIRMRWEQLDLAAKTFTFTGSRTKIGNTVQFSEQAYAILFEEGEVKESGPVFPSAETNYQHQSITKTPVEGVFKKKLIPDLHKKKPLPKTPNIHGYKGNISTWADLNKYERNFVKHCLGQTPDDPLDKAYLASPEYADRFRAMLQAWADHLDGL